MRRDTTTRLLLHPDQLLFRLYIITAAVGGLESRPWLNGSFIGKTLSEARSALLLALAVPVLRWLWMMKRPAKNLKCLFCCCSSFFLFWFSSVCRIFHPSPATFMRCIITHTQGRSPRLWGTNERRGVAEHHQFRKPFILNAFCPISFSPPPTNMINTKYCKTMDGLVSECAKTDQRGDVSMEVYLVQYKSDEFAGYEEDGWMVLRWMDGWDWLAG